MRLLSLFILLILFLASTSQAQKRYDEITYPELNEFNQPDVETFTLDNGLKFFLVEDRELPLIDVSVMVRTGGVLVPNEKAGLASITGTVIRSGGTENYPADSLNALLENKAASMETYIGFTSGGGGMNVLKEDFDELLPVFIDVLMNPVFPEDKIGLAKTQMKTSISRRNDDAQQIGFREFDRLIYGNNSVYGRNTEYETVNNIERKDLVNFHNKHFTGRNMMIGLVGDFKTKQMKKKLRKAFASVPAGTATDLEFPDVNYKFKNTINFINKSDVNQSTILLGHIGGLRNNPDFAKIEVLDKILHAPFTGRLFKVVRTELGLAYAAFGNYENNSFYKGVYYSGTFTKSATTAEAIDAIIRQIERLQKEPVTQKELKDTKDQFLNSLVFRYDSFEEVLSERMSNDYRGLPRDAFEKYVEGFKATTIEDVQQVARKYLHPDKLEILVVGNENEIGNQLQKYGDVNEIDISIPQPGDEEEDMAKGDIGQGKKMLQNMSDAIIQKGKDVTSVTIYGETTRFNPGNPQQAQNVETTVAITYPDMLRMEIMAPGGAQTIILEGGNVKVKMGNQEQQLPSQLAKQFQAELNRNILTVARQGADLEASYLGTDTVEGEKLEKLRVTTSDGNNITYLIDPATHLPQIMRYKQFNPQAGENMNIEVHYSNWKGKDGVSYAYLQTTYQGGQKTSETRVKSVEINPEDQPQN